ncbi:Transcription factor, MADS-box [Corchorus capsularis]|uniref:Transcription factor, MADS-box n=1 Tax=Corchorus capsularis TaxID=210143 RepID=A0A1R3GCP9_COCAP|nr:Transcription factor, MADS-box [Corchorus capsularis]
MGRGKLNMKLIAKEKVRLATYQKRKKGLIKKAHEFSILCGVDTCVILYGPKTKDGPSKLEIWPSDQAKVMKVINKYKSKPLDARERKSFNVFDFLDARQKKIDDEIWKLRKSNLEAKFSPWDERINNLAIDQIWALLSGFDSKLEAAKKKIKMMKENCHRHHCLIDESNQPRLNVPDHQLRPCIFPKNFDLEVTSRQQQQQPMLGLKPFDMNVPSYYPFGPDEALPMQPFNSNPIDLSMKKLTPNGFDYTQLDGESSSSITHNSSLSPQTGYDPMLDKVMFNNPWGLPICFYPPFMQPMPPFGHSSTAMPSFPSHQYGEFFDDQYESRNKEHKF